jgi:DNA-binding MarR family transcriptional regulator
MTAGANIMTKRTEIFSSEPYRVEESVGYLLSRARTKLAKSLDVALIERGITHAQGSILLMLSTGKYETAADLARELYIDSASMTRMIDRLEKRGLLFRVRRDDDRRVVSLRLTGAGQELARQLPEVYVVVRNRNFAGFSAEELATLSGLLRKFLAYETPEADIQATDE